jgi:hypothetical protein
VRYEWRKEADECNGRDELILGHLWMVKDMVSRFRAHWPEARRFTDDLVSVGMEAMTEFFTGNEYDFNKLNYFMHNRMRDFVNYNRSTFSASTKTNERREAANRPLEYNYAGQIIDDITGEDDYHVSYVDILDAVERLAEVDQEDMHTLILHFLNRNHEIDEASLTDDEKAAIARLSEIVRSL